MPIPNPIKHIDESRIRKLKKFEVFNENDIWYIYILALLVNSKYDNVRLNLNNFDMKIIKEVNGLLNKKFKENEKDDKIYSIFHKLNEISVAAFYVFSQNKAVERYLEVLKDIKVSITGADLIELGYVPSPKFPQMFERVLKEKFKGKLKTKEDEIKFLKKCFKIR